MRHSSISIALSGAAERSTTSRPVIASSKNQLVLSNDPRIKNPSLANNPGAGPKSCRSSVISNAIVSLAAASATSSSSGFVSTKNSHIPVDSDPPRRIGRTTSASIAYTICVFCP